MDNSIKQNIAECHNIVNHIRGSIYNGNCNRCFQCRELSNLYNSLSKLSRSIKSNLPVEELFIQKYLPTLVGTPKMRLDNLGAIEVIINMIMTKYDSKNVSQKKIFISHSSNDKAIVQLFVDDILQLGIGLKPEQIFCTSIEDMGIKNGEDFRNHIHNNIKNADYSFLLISDNYKSSEICLNEMGAVWAYNNNVKLYLLPNTSFDSIGWLCNTRIAEKIDNPIVLDYLHEQLQQYYSLQNSSITSWSRQREKFRQDIKLI